MKASKKSHLCWFICSN